LGGLIGRLEEAERPRVAERFIGHVLETGHERRVVAYIPQIAKAARDRSGAEAISLGTWGLFLFSHASAAAYALVNQKDWTMASVFLGNAVGCCAIILIAAWKRSQHRRRQIEETA
jgi:hypothetical protein